jgi:hypothetical protein
MLGRFCALKVGTFALALATAFGCGGATSQGDAGGQPSAGVSGAAAVGGAGATGGASGAGGTSAAPIAGAASTDPPPVQTGCAPDDLPPPVLECDPFEVGSCGPDSGCYPFVEHPEGSGCEAQSYGARCRPSGVGVQGELCGQAQGDWCAAGHVCVVGQRAGKRCAALCRPGVSGQCSGGLICGDLDVAGFGVCG